MNLSEKVIVSVCEGKVQGYKNKSPFSETEFYSFLGVPYGQSTGGFARFQDPEAVKPWKNIFKANTEKGGCYQYVLHDRRLHGSEDCLYNNIHTPKIPENYDEESLKAVIVLIHPGSGYTGSPDPAYFGSPDYIMHNDIVYVCISFRIHILGFLNLNLKECAGNQTLKDIILSLKWIQKNINKFGGDPNNVTLLGSSSGAHVINELMISPRGKGLFHKAVIMGMYKYCPSIYMPKENSQLAFGLAQDLGYKGPFDERKLLMFFRRIQYSKVINARSDRFFLEERAPIYPTGPFLSTRDFGENPVIPLVDKQKELESMARIPLMVGFCEKETVIGFLTPYLKLSMNNFYRAIRQNCWGWGHNLNDDQLELIQNRIESYYLDGKSIEDAPTTLRCDIQTDIALSDVYDSLINVIAADCPRSVFVYKFEFEGNVKKMKDLFEYIFDEPIKGTYHGDDFSYWAHTRHPQDPREDILTPQTREIVKTFTKLISTFAKTGNPNYDGLTTQWEPTTVENPCYLSINKDLHMVNGKLNGKRMEFLESLKKELESNDPTYDDH